MRHALVDIIISLQLTNLFHPIGINRFERVIINAYAVQQRKTIIFSYSYE